jgi:hypothetical protein
MRLDIWIKMRVINYPNITPWERISSQYSFAIDASSNDRVTTRTPRMIGARIPIFEIRKLLKGPVAKAKPKEQPPIQPRSKVLRLRNRESDFDVYASYFTVKTHVRARR